MVRRSDFLHIAPQAWIGAAMILLAVPIHWAGACLFAAIIHELCHCLAITLCGERVVRVEIGIRGAKIESSPLSTGKSIVCALAGPVGGLLLGLGSSTFPRLATCGFLQSVFNLLPFYPLDGGRALRGIICLIRERWEKRKIPCK